jgi:hypothetical protein
MDSQQIMEFLLAMRTKAEAHREADKEERKAEKEETTTNQAKMEAGHKAEQIIVGRLLSYKKNNGTNNGIPEGRQGRMGDHKEGR